MLFQEHESAHDYHDGDRKQHAVCSDALRGSASKFCPGNHERSDENGNHSEASLPDAESPHRRSFGDGVTIKAACQKTESNKPCHGRNQRHIEDAAGVVEMEIDG